jgi:acylphosphatase
MQARIFILGFVQGVGFRKFVRKKAKDLGLKGYVRNLPDTRVETVVSGPKDKIEELIKSMEKGTFFADVKSVQVEWEKEEEFEDFKILH